MSITERQCPDGLACGNGSLFSLAGIAWSSRIVGELERWRTGTSKAGIGNFGPGGPVSYRV